MRPKRAWIALGLALYALAPLFAILGSAPFVSMVFHSVLFGTMALGYGARSIKNPRFREGTLSFDGAALSLDARPIARREEITAAFVVPTPSATLVRLERRGRLRLPLFVRVRDQEEAAALVLALGFGAEQVAAEMRIASALLAMPLPVQAGLLLAPTPLFVAAVTLLAAATHSAAVVAALVAGLFAYVFTLSFAPMRVRVGTDGVVTRWLGRTRWIDHAQIEGAVVYDERISTKRQHGVRLLLAGGEELRLPTGQTDVGQAEAARLVTRILEAREARRRGAKGGGAELLARGERDVTGWVRFLRGLGAGSVDPRSPAVPRDVLLRIVEDSHAAPLDRASAAVAATEAADPDAKRRVRVAAQASASPKLRVALERIAEAEDEEAVAEALRALSRSS